jgi:Zn-finger nucleic acid-binding protein
MTERERTGVLVDFCSNCRGVWLDGGELEKLIEREERFYRERSNDERGRDRRRDRDDRNDRDDDDDDGQGGFLQNVLDLFGN